jgi:hypothetical protein
MPRHHEPLLTARTILWLQTTSGNRAVQRLLKRKALERQKMLQCSASQKLQIIPPASQGLVHRKLVLWWRLLWASFRNKVW